MKLQNFFGLAVLTLVIMFTGVSCTTKEGAPGPKGDQGDPGADGLNATETCKQCHNPSVVDAKAVEFQFSKHEYGEAAFEESGSPGCSPCHTQLGFQDVVKRNVSSAFVLNTTSGRYENQYNASTSSDIGELGCFTCHSSLHTTYAYSDFEPYTTTAAVPMTMWGGAKTINLTQDGGISNLCIKCHQPRPFTNSNGDRNVLNYAGLVSNPTAIFYNPAATTTNVLIPGYRTHTHYGTVGAIYAGVGGVEFPGNYGQMLHATKASCSDCHQAPMTNRAGGHTFFAKGNFNGCNTTDCHALTPVSATNAKYWVTPRATVKALLEQLAAKLKYNGIEILNKQPDTEANLWVTLTSGKYDGYLNIYDPVNNPNGLTNNAGTFQSPSPSSSWTAEQKATNLALPKLTLTNAQMGAIINFQLCLREYSLGIHNLDYSKALLTNSLAILP